MAGKILNVGADQELVKVRGKPAFMAGPHSLWRWSNKPFTHIKLSLPLARAPAIID
jgi:hypothetical protein